MCRVQILILLLALVVQILTPVFCYSIDDNRIDVHNVAAPSYGGAVRPHAPVTTIHHRRMFGLCPPHFHRIGSECYLISGEHKNWLEAHFFCKAKNAKLAEPQRNADRKIREYLLRHFPSHIMNEPLWIGVTYDWNNNVWQWGLSVKNLYYQAFEPMENSKNLENHCAMYNPSTNYRWSAGLCTDRQRFICQHKMPKVSGRNLHKVYERWNATYPNEYANQVILEVIDRKNGKRPNRRLKAEDSREVFLMPNSRKNVHMQNVGNLNKRPATHRTSMTTTTTTTTTTISPNHSASENEILRPRKSSRGNPRRRTDYDRRLHLERQKERRLNRRRKAHKFSTTTTAIPTPTTTTTRPTASSLKPENIEMRRQAVDVPANIQAENENQKLIDEKDMDMEKERLRIHYLNMRKEAEQRELEKLAYEKQQHEKSEREESERLKKERQLQLEYEEKIKQAQAEQERLRERELQLKQMRDEENRRLLEQQENERLAREKAAEKEEELRRQREDLENARRLEQQELERLQRERELHEEQKRKAAEKFRLMEEEQRRREAEEAAAAEEERQRQQELEQRMRMTATPEPDPETTTTTRKPNTTKSSRWIEADELARKAEEAKRRKYAERIMRLTPEQQKQWLIERKRRKLNKKNKLAQQ